MKHTVLQTADRDYGFDNIRGILIACVVFGHMLEVCAPFPWHNSIYRIIYSFHMPVFVFITGYFSQFSRRKLLFNWVSPYLVFQTVYIVVEQLLGKNVRLQYSTPYWHLWFLLVCAGYQLLIPLYDVQTVPKRLAVLGCVATVSLLAGFDRSIGEVMGLSRFFVFQPWFVLGYYFRKHMQERPKTAARKHPVLQGVVISGCTALVVWRLAVRGLSNRAFYGAYPYANANGTLQNRAMLMAMAVVWICFFFVVVKPVLSKKIPLLTTLGQNTLPVFLFHASIIKWLPTYLPQLFQSRVLVIATTVGTLLLFGNPWVGKVMHMLFSDRFIKKALQHK